LVVVRRKSRVAQKTFSGAGSETDGVDVERLLRAVAKGLLHISLLLFIWPNVSEPVGVHCASGVLQDEGEPRGIIVGIENINLCGDVLIPISKGHLNVVSPHCRSHLRHITTCFGGILRDDMEEDADLRSSLAVVFRRE
jgi:hypothetical protein